MSTLENTLPKYDYPCFNPPNTGQRIILTIIFTVFIVGVGSFFIKLDRPKLYGILLILLIVLWFFSGTIRDCFARNKYLAHLAETNDELQAEKLTELDLEIRKYKNATRSLNR